MDSSLINLHQPHHHHHHQTNQTNLQPLANPPNIISQHQEQQHLQRQHQSYLQQQQQLHSHRILQQQQQQQQSFKQVVRITITEVELVIFSSFLCERVKRIQRKCIPLGRSSSTIFQNCAKDWPDWRWIFFFRLILSFLNRVRMNIDNLKGQTDEKLNFVGWICTLRE